MIVARLHKQLSAALLLAASLSISGACNRSVSHSPDRNKTAAASSSRPPFKTIEPERYKATRIITSKGANGETRISTTRTERDGPSRREEFETIEGVELVYLENSGGLFVLVPDLKIYSNLLDEQGSTSTAADEDRIANPTHGLLRFEPAGSNYQTLGDELIDARATTKYRVSSTGDVGSAKEETYIWVDQILGFPIRSETNYVADGVSSHLVMQVRDIESKVDPASFLLPSDYQKVDHSVLLERLRQNGRK